MAYSLGSTDVTIAIRSWRDVMIIDNSNDPTSTALLLRNADLHAMTNSITADNSASYVYGQPWMCSCAFVAVDGLAMYVV